MEQIKIGFISGSATTDLVKVNYWTRILTGPYIHCELIFRDEQTGVHNLACSVMYGRTVYMEPREFTRDEWSFLKISVTSKQYRLIKKWCDGIVAQERPFNNNGFWRAITPFPRSTDDTQFFCSELVCRAFQQIGMFNDALPSTLTPTELKSMIEAQFDTCVDMSHNVESRIRKSGGLRFGGAVSKLSTNQPMHSSMLKHTWNSAV